MKKSLIKSLLPVLIIVLALSMVTITAFADNYTGFVYDGEEKGTTTDQIFFDGLDRVKTALEAAEKAGKFDGLDTKGEALKPEEKPGKFDGLNRETKALEAEEKVGTFDGLDTNGDALKAEEKAGIYDGFHTPKPVEKPADDIDGKA